jgi:DNA-directed RNA polymerase subunit RPC12/RpoP
MTTTIEITVPAGHSADPTCPHCHEPIGPCLRDIYPDSEPNEIGGELECPHCDGRLLVSVFRPEPTFHVSPTTWYPENVTHIRRGRG